MVCMRGTEWRWFWSYSRNTIFWACWRPLLPYNFARSRPNAQSREPMPPRRSRRTRTTPKPIYSPATRANQATEPAAMSQDVQGTRQSSEMGSGATADQRPASPPATMPADKADTVLQQLASIANTQKQIISKGGNKGAKIDRHYNELKQNFATEIKQVRDDDFLELAEVNKRLENLKRVAPTSESVRTPFEPDTTVVIANLPLLAARSSG